MTVLCVVGYRYGCFMCSRFTDMTVLCEVGYRYGCFVFISTLLTQECVITVQGVPLTNYLEGIVESTCNSNAQKVGLMMVTSREQPTKIIAP